MKRPTRHWRTIVIAAAALVVAGAGATFARTSPDVSQITPAEVRKIAKAVADAEIARLAPRLSVRSARTAGTAATANAPAMFAQVTADGGVTTNSRGIAQGNVVRAAKGLYCFTGLASTPKGGVVIIDAAIPGPGSGGDLAQVGLGQIVHRLIGSCPAGTQAYVVTFTTEGVVVDDPFFVVLWF